MVFLRVGTRSASSRLAFAATIAVTGREFWPLYSWPWNKYHELNADSCSDGNTFALVVYGRGREGSFAFPGKKPADLAGLLALAMQRLSEH